ncbi:riboflavin biosynthesis protein RibF [Gloeothece citriformis PCC 7424]|uniref:Riboflavin biosynthesis protein n=1 Tax=Gloeothece citriformis (strain PCC 7424) TaxID=65393 RepID=B7KL30_GLOC7|nr:bifunctional riboflavin kinase/FAD synthetase [Gloeothece citriformis]ACK72402.1 riboflavin biosynthesis protein RibF [Gloeothece citriformis PCC 7424]
MWLVKSSTDQILTPTAIALGNFDGIHLGHQKVISSIWTHSSLVAPPERSPVKDPKKIYSDCYSTVVTFNPHPREFFSGQKKQCLTPLAEKILLLEQLGVEQLILLPFDQKLASLSPQAFVEEILVEKLQGRRVSVGADFRFGCQRTGGAEDLKAIASQFGIEVFITSLKTNFSADDPSENLRISSSRIRQALAEGKIEDANQMLGRPYTLTGTVVTGQKLGRTLGFPTANLELPQDKLLPRFGVYAVRVEIKEHLLDTDSKTGFQGVINIGCRPTVAGESPTVEVHLLDWSGDLYGQCLIVSLEQFIRSEAKFPSLDALKAQIGADCELARKILQVEM